MTANATPLPTRRPAQIRAYPVCPLKTIMDTIKNKCGDVRVMEKHGNGPNKVIILPEAMRELEVMVSYGRRSPMNAKEQKFTGYGHFLKDEAENTVVIVKHFIEIQTMNRSAVSASNFGPNGEYNPGLDFLQYHREEFLKMETQYNTDAFGGRVDPFIGLCGASEFVLEGHTHPDLGVFFSEPDKASGAARAATSPVCIFVCDPIRKKMLGSIGKGFSKAEIIVYARGSDAPADPVSDARRIYSPDEIVRIASRCLRSCEYDGDIKLRTRIDGRKCMIIKLIKSKMKKE